MSDQDLHYYQLEKEIITFASNPSDPSNNICLVNITNLLDKKLAIRCRCKERKLYLVTPSHLILDPNEIKELKFSYHGPYDNIPENKYKFEGIIIDDADKDKDIKDILKKYDSEKRQYSVIKAGVNFVSSQNNISIEQSQFFKSYIDPMDNSKELNEKLEEYKVEYYKVKDEINSLNSKLNQTKTMIENESKRNTNTLLFTKNESNPDENDKQKKFSYVQGIAVCAVSFILGLILTK